MRAWFEPYSKAHAGGAPSEAPGALDLRKSAINREVSFIFEAFRQYVIYWLIRTEPHALGRRRFDWLIDQLAAKIADEKTPGSIDKNHP
ncbi:hypothetical protein [Hyphococcus luteus]|uniref:Uncharacterized protein n=1 Tax=Hyphococcus luteus TaxID=2058213 RepID=A0A2S7K6Z8_9PROT|nr:hypothetical protein [Marinicaulis flavus]PQA88241.1 hypothetical protein CW354_08025 [Marinicaulis flavus]